MNKKQCANLVAAYQYELDQREIRPRRALQTRHPSPEAELAHARWMIERMKEMIVIWPKKREKFFRWLGFVQGVLWANKIFTLTKLRSHNR